MGDRSVLIRLASSLTKGDLTRVAILRSLKSGVETFHTASGKKFKIDNLVLAKALRQELGATGVEIGMYVRGENPIPDHVLSNLVLFHGAVELGRSTSAPRPPSAPKALTPNQEEDLTLKLIHRIREILEKEPPSVGDLFLNMDPENSEEDFISHLEGISGDSTYEVDYFLEQDPKAQKILNRLKGSKGGALPRNLLYRLREAYADFWFSAASREWEKLKMNKSRMDRLRATRAQY